MFNKDYIGLNTTINGNGICIAWDDFEFLTNFINIGKIKEYSLQDSDAEYLREKGLSDDEIVVEMLVSGDIDFIVEEELSRLTKEMCGDGEVLFLERSHPDYIVIYCPDERYGFKTDTTIRDVNDIVRELTLAVTKGKDVSERDFFHGRISSMISII